MKTRTTYDLTTHVGSNTVGNKQRNRNERSTKHLESKNYLGSRSDSRVPGATWSCTKHGREPSRPRGMVFSDLVLDTDVRGMRFSWTFPVEIQAL